MASFAGAVILPEQQKTLVFKNRDLATTNHNDSILYDVDCFGIRGINQDNGEALGIAIGVNRYGLAVANTHVRSTPDPSFQVLAEQILIFAKDAEDGFKMATDHLKSGRNYQWGNLILADHDRTLAIEIAGGEYAIEWSERKVLRTSHHIMLDTEDELQKHLSEQGDGSFEDSVNRMNRGYDLVRRIDDTRDVFELLKDHGDAKGPSSLCKHGLDDSKSRTAMSYVIEVDHQQESGRPKAIFHASKGYPCESSYTSIPLVFPADEEIMKRAIGMYPK